MNASRTARAKEATALFGMTPGRAGGLLLASWHFPALYVAVVEHCDNPLAPECAPDMAGKVALVHAGKRLAEGLAANLAVEEAVRLVSPDVCGAFDLDPDLLTEVYKSLPERTSLEQLEAAR